MEVHFHSKEWKLPDNVAKECIEDALLSAVKDENITRVRTLIKAGANINRADWSGGTSLIQAARSGNVAIAKTLLTSGANVDDAELQSGWTALHWAALRGDDTVAEVLLNAKADPNIRDQDGKALRDLIRDRGK